MSSLASVVISGNCSADGSNVRFTLYDDGRFVMSGTGSSKDYIPLISRSPWADYRNDITSVTVQEGVTRVGNYSFYNSDSLVTISLPNSLTSIGNNVFADCDNITTITIPVKVNYANSGLRNCTTITKATFTPGTTGIWYDYYDSASQIPTYGSRAVLTDITISSGVTTIGSYAFYECPGFRWNMLPSGITNIGNYAFYGCTGISGTLNLSALHSLTRIGAGAFQGCTSISGTLTIPQGVSLSDYSFRGCVGITGLVLPSTLTNIPTSTFRGCASITSLSFPESLTSIGAYAFAECFSVSSMTFRAQGLSIASHAFDQCTAMSTIYFMQSGQGVTFATNSLSFGTSVLPVIVEVYSPNNWAETANLSQYSNAQTTFRYVSSAYLQTITFMVQSDPSQSGGYVLWDTVPAHVNLTVMPAQPTNSNGYVFVGWSLESSGADWSEVTLNTSFDSDTTVYARWSDEAAFSLVFVLDPGSAPLSTWGAKDISQNNIGTWSRLVGVDDAHTKVAKWRYNTAEQNIAVSFTTPADNSITFPDGMEHTLVSNRGDNIARWFTLAPYQPLFENPAVLTLARMNQDHSFSNTAYPSWIPAPSDTGGRAVLCAPGALPLDMGEIQTVSKTYRSNLSVFPIACYGYDRTFAMDLGTSMDLSLSYIRVEPPNASPTHDGATSDSREWTNEKWLSALRALQNRWQMRTNGQTFYLLNSSSQEDRGSATTYKEMKNVNCYISSAPVTYSTMGPHAISGSLNLQIGTLYPKKETPAMKKVTFALGGAYANQWPNYTETVEAIYPEQGLIVLPGYDPWGPVKIEWGQDNLPKKVYSIIGWAVNGNTNPEDLFQPGKPISVSILQGPTPTIVAITDMTDLANGSIKYAFGPSNTQTSYSNTFTVVPDENAPSGAADVGMIVIGGGGGGAGSRTIAYAEGTVYAAGVHHITSAVIACGGGGSGGGVATMIGENAYRVFGQQTFSYTLGAGGSAGSARADITDSSYIDTSGGSGSPSSVSIYINGKKQGLVFAQGGAGASTPDLQSDNKYRSNGGSISDYADVPAGGSGGDAEYAKESVWYVGTVGNGQAGQDGVTGSGGSRTTAKTKVSSYSVYVSAQNYRMYCSGAGGGGGEQFIPGNISYTKGNAGATQDSQGITGINGQNATHGCGGGGGGCSIDARIDTPTAGQEVLNLSYTSNGSGGAGGRGFIIIYAVTGEGLTDPSGGS